MKIKLKCTSAKTGWTEHKNSNDNMSTITQCPLEIQVNSIKSQVNPSKIWNLIKFNEI